ncbi:DUF998 domain-containing protein [Pseudonocardia sp. TRM90224]|uniref:DUF998 domain-containing protein n=1 Tax=Pseudonocardia sp. TRM90224 TaxID=2812678 RepID=UPI001E59727D|nr:DUF998 domain-containing protein [Pseudonocardia sp. TRM90224]
MATKHRPAKRWWGIGTLLLALLALVSAARCAITLVYLGFEYSAEVNPIATPASYYVFTDGGGPPYTTAAVALAVAMLAVLVGMTWAGVRMAGRPTMLYTVWSMCLLLAAIFPTDNSPNIETFGGWVHQFAGAGILALLSFAGFAAAPRLAENPSWAPVVGQLRMLSAGAAVLALAYLLSRAIEFIPGMVVPFGITDVDGALQRMVFAFDIAVIAALAVHLVRVSVTTLRDKAEAWTADPAARPLER